MDMLFSKRLKFAAPSLLGLAMVCPLAGQAIAASLSEPMFSQEETAALPTELQEALLRFDEFEQGRGALPEVLKVARADLNSDGATEYVVQSSRTYSGGPMHYIFEFRDGHFVQIADCQGTLEFVSTDGTYLGIDCTSRGGAGRQTRTLLRHDGSRYQIAMTSRKG